MPVAPLGYLSCKIWDMSPIKFFSQAWTVSVALGGQQGSLGMYRFAVNPLTVASHWREGRQHSVVVEQWTAGWRYQAVCHVSITLKIPLWLMRRTVGQVTGEPFGSGPDFGDGSVERPTGRRHADSGEGGQWSRPGDRQTDRRTDRDRPGLDRQQA